MALGMDHTLSRAPEHHGPNQHRGQMSVGVYHDACTLAHFSHTRDTFLNPQVTVVRRGPRVLRNDRQGRLLGLRHSFN